jgi:hypothetical protein
MMPRVHFFAFVLSIGLATSAAFADLVIDDALPLPRSERGVGAAVTFGPSVGSMDMTGGPYSAMASSTNGMGIGTLTAMADQDSTTPDLVGPSMAGMGNTMVHVDSWDAVANMSGYSVMADSFFDVYFEVDVTGIYTLSAMVSFSGMFPSGSGGGSAIVELLDVTAAPVTLHSVTKLSTDPPGSATLSPTLVTLSMGDKYRLFARAGMSLGGVTMATSDAMGHWEFDLSAVPEVGSFIAMTPLALIGVISVWLKRQRNRSPNQCKI